MDEEEINSLVQACKLLKKLSVHTKLSISNFP